LRWAAAGFAKFGGVVFARCRRRPAVEDRLSGFGSPGRVVTSARQLNRRSDGPMFKFPSGE